MREITELAKLLPRIFKDSGNEEERKRVAFEYNRLAKSWKFWPKDGLKRNQVATLCKCIWLAMNDSERREAQVRARDYIEAATRKDFYMKHLSTWLIDTFGRRLQDRLPAWLQHRKQTRLF